MPYVHVSTNKAFDSAQKNELQTKLGDLISIMPGKTPEQTLIQITDDCSMYRRGFDGPLAIIEISIYQMQPFGYKSKLVSAIYELMERDCGIPAANLYIKFSEMPIWGAGGALK